MNPVDLSLVPQGEQVLVGVSGGMDSMVLLHALAQHGEVRVAHFNHQLRGKASDADEALVRRTAKKLAVPFYVERIDVKSVARDHKLSIEMAARKCRHEFFARLARKMGVTTIALAHHADDQVELFFLRLLRGAGPEGLAGMRKSGPSPVDRALTIVRPLLQTTKCDIRAYAKQHQIPFREDATNASTAILRNRIRHKLIPLLERDYQPGLTQTILRVTELLRAESDLIARNTERSQKPFDELPVALQRRHLREQLHAAAIETTFELVEHLRLHPDAPITVGPQRLVSRDSSGTLKLSSLTHWSADSLSVSLGPGGSIEFGGKSIRWECETSKSQRASGAEYFDADKIGPIITLRHWQPGDRFQPIGMTHSVKLQDLFTNLKVPRAERHRRVVATTAEGQIFWVEGARIAEPFKVKATTQRVLKWRAQGRT